MTILNRSQFKLLVIFYKSNLLLSFISGLLLAVLNFHDFFTAFGFSFLSAGTVISITYKEISKQHEYYFYYNKGISKLTLIASCALINMVIGVLIISIGNYA